ncbi:MAG: glycosyl hydrolase family 28-related protein [Synechococcaceae cyanobacterium]
MLEVFSAGERLAMVQSGLFGQHGSGFQASGTGAVQRHLKDKLAETVSVLDFGARGDGKADDTAAIQRALDAHPLVLLPPGTYRISDTLVLRRSGGGLIGSGTLPVLRMDQPDRCAIRLTPPPNGLAAWIRVENLDIMLGPGVEPAYARHPNAGGCAIAIDGAGSTAHAAGVQRAQLRNLRLLGWACGVWMRRHVNTVLERVVVEHWRRGTKASGGRYVGFSFAGDAAAAPPGAAISPQASVEVVHCLFNGDGAPAGVGSIGFHVQGADVRDIYFDRCETANCDEGWLIESATGDYNWNIHIRRPLVDRFGRHAIALRDLSGPAAVSVLGGYTVPSRGAGAAIDATNCSGLAVAGGIQVLGVAGEGTPSQGLRLERCRNSTISGLTLFNNSVGVELRDCGGCVVSGCSVHGGTSFFERQPQLDTGIRISGASRGCLISGNTIAGIDAARRYGRGIVVEESASDCLVVDNSVDPQSVAEPYRVAPSGNVMDALLANGQRRLSAPRQELISSHGPQVYGGSDPAFPHRFVDGQGQELVRLSSGGSWISRSDARLKCAISELPYGLAELRRLEPRAYHWRQALESASPAQPAIAESHQAPEASQLRTDPALEAASSPGDAASGRLASNSKDDVTHAAAANPGGAGVPGRQLGLLAQEVRQVLPELVAEVGPAGELGLDYTGLLPVLIRAVQELDARLSQLEPGAAAAGPSGDGRSS